MYNLKAVLKSVVKNHLINFSCHCGESGFLYKNIWVVALNVFSIINGKVGLTDEQKNICLKIKIGQMPTSYLRTLAQIINNL